MAVDIRCTPPGTVKGKGGLRMELTCTIDQETYNRFKGEKLNGYLKDQTIQAAKEYCEDKGKMKGNEVDEPVVTPPAVSGGRANAKMIYECVGPMSTGYSFFTPPSFRSFFRSINPFLEVLRSRAS